MCIVPADFMDVVALPTQVPLLPRLGFFPGSTIGNLDPPEAQRFLQRARTALGRDSWFLVGVDLRKDPAILLPAYDDAQGVTAVFNRNLLVRLNREAAADFDLGAFAHRAVWNDMESRIEMHLVSLREPDSACRRPVDPIRPGETIHTENSYKYAPERFAALAEACRMAQRGAVDRSGAAVLIASAGTATRTLPSERYAASAIGSPVR